MTKEQFDLKYRGEKVAVHCDTEEKANAFLKLAKGVGYKWVGNSDLEKTDNMWHMMKENTVYSVFDGYVTYSSKQTAKKSGHKIINFELDEPKETIKVGDVVTDTIIGTNAKIVDIKPYYLLQGYGFYVSEDRIQKVKSLKKITKKELADMGYEVEEK